MIEVKDWYDLNNIRNDTTLEYVLVNSIDENTDGYDELASSNANEGLGWIPIPSFGGKINGQYYTIKGFNVTGNNDNVGLFEDVTGTIENVKVVDFSTSGRLYVGGLTARCNGTIKNCYVRGQVNGSSRVGGISGEGRSGNILNSYSDSVVSGNRSGCLVGYNNGISIKNCFARGNVNGSSDVGGLIGTVHVQAYVENCFSTASVTGTESTVGGLVGSITDTSLNHVYNSFSDKELSGQEKAVGVDNTAGENTDNVQSLSTEQMKNIATYNMWDSDIWVLQNERYPMLFWMERLIARLTNDKKLLISNFIESDYLSFKTDGSLIVDEAIEEDGSLIVNNEYKLRVSEIIEGEI